MKKVIITLTLMKYFHNNDTKDTLSFQTASQVIIIENRREQ